MGTRHPLESKVNPGYRSQQDEKRKTDDGDPTYTPGEPRQHSLSYLASFHLTEYYRFRGKSQEPRRDELHRDACHPPKPSQRNQSDPPVSKSCLTSNRIRILPLLTELAHDFQ